MKYSCLTLISHRLCPYVQRSVITLQEKQIQYERKDIDLSNKPQWFLDLSPLGKVPCLLVNESEVLFESAVICEFLDEITPGSLHPDDEMLKAKHRAWIEYGSQLLNDIARLYNAKDASALRDCCQVIEDKLKRLEGEVRAPFFAGDTFHLVDAVYGPIFRYFDVLACYLPKDLFAQLTQLNRWRDALRERPSVKNAVGSDYAHALLDFVQRRNSYLGLCIAAKAA